MSRIFASLFCSIVISTTVYAAPGRTLQSFGVTVNHGQPVRPYPANVAIGLYDPDPLLDLACYTDGKIQVWRNQGDSTFGNAPVFEQKAKGEVAKLEWHKSHMLTQTIFDRYSWGDLYLTYLDGTMEKISHEWMANATASFASLAQRPNDPPLLNFHEVWRSQPDISSHNLLAGDIDNDGQIELIYMFDSFSGDTSRYVIFGCAGSDSRAKAHFSFCFDGWGKLCNCRLQGVLQLIPFHNVYLRPDLYDLRTL